MSFNEIDKKKQQLINVSFFFLRFFPIKINSVNFLTLFFKLQFSKVLDELEEEEAVEFNNLISKARKTNETRIVLKKELKYLRISQNINAMHRFTYFDYRYNLPLCKL